jgi:hypothetical protein
MIRRSALCGAALLVLALASPAAASAATECELNPAPSCFGLDSVDASLSTAQAGAHPDLSFDFDIAENPTSAPNAFGLKDSYAATRNVRFELPPGLIGNPNVLGVSEQCTVEEFVTYNQPGGGCPNASQIGVSKIFAYELTQTFNEPVYMMQPPGGDIVARLGVVAGIYPTFIDLRVRTESDYGLTAEIRNASAQARLLRAETTNWGVPAAKIHDTERCTPAEAFAGCAESPPRPPGSRPLTFLTNPTRCGVPLEMRVAASSWVEPERYDTKSAALSQITGCDGLPFGPDLTIEPTNHRAGAPTGLDVTIRLPGSDGVNVLEPSQMREAKVKLPAGLTINTGSADGLSTCSESEVRFGKSEDSHCSDAAKIADVELDIPALPRRMKGAIYLREPEKGNLFRFWIVADDLGAHVKLPGKLQIDQQSGQIESIALDPQSTLPGLPQAPLREVKLEFKSGFRAPLLNPEVCGTYMTSYEFVPWSGGPPFQAQSSMKIDEGCNGLGGFAPKLSAGTTEPAAGAYSPFLFTLTREDGEQNPAALDVTLPPGLAANFSGVERCQGAPAETGACPSNSRIGKVIAATGAGAAPLWIPQPGKRPTVVYLGGPYKGAPFSAIAVVPAQAGPFDLGDVVVRSAIHVDPIRAQGIVNSDPLPQIIEGVPVHYRTIQVVLDRERFTLNPTGCDEKVTTATVTSSYGAVATPMSRFHATNCAQLPFQPKLSLTLKGGTHRGGHPQLHAVLKGRPGDANIAAISAALPHSEFLDQGNIGTVCTRVQFAADQCPPGSIYGHAVVRTPLFENPLAGPVYLRSSNHALPDLVVRLRGEIEVVTASRIDSINGGIRNIFDVIPDAPLTRVDLSIPGGGKKGLLENSTNLCAATHRATVKFSAQNGRQLTTRPALKVSCPHKGQKR